MKQAGRKRRGAVTVELAVAAPLMFAMLFGIIEFGWLFTVQHTMVNAAREGARLGSLSGVTITEIEERVDQFLAPMNLETKVTTTVTEATTDEPVVTVTLTVPQADVSLVGNFFGLTMGTVTGTASMRKEGL